jgi:selenocysteine lyase/cysteine desulfurase
MSDLSSLAAFRARFPILARRVYLNSCSQGALSTDVAQAFERFLESWHEHGSPWDGWVRTVEELRAAFAASIGASPDEVAIVPSASAGINAVASAFRFGDRPGIVLGEFEFPTAAHVWLAQQPRGAEIRWVKARGETLTAEAYRAAIDERTLMVPATHLCFRNGFKVDVAALASVCRERGAHLFLDDYQRTGTGPIDVGALGVDFLVTGALKYLLGPSGVAFLYVRRELIERLEPSVTGWFGRANPFAFSIDRLDWAPSARRFETGTPPVPNAYGALAGLELLAGINLSVVEAQIGRLVQRFCDGASAAGHSLMTPADPARRGPLVVLRSTDAPALVYRLARRGVITSARGNGLRVSFHAYNNEGDVDAALAALKAEEELLRV